MPKVTAWVEMDSKYSRETPNHYLLEKCPYVSDVLSKEKKKKDRKGKNEGRNLMEEMTLNLSVSRWIIYYTTAKKWKTPRNIL